MMINILQATPIFAITALSLLLVIINAFEKKGNIAFIVSITTLLTTGVVALASRTMGQTYLLPSFITDMLVFNSNLMIFDMIFAFGGLLTIWLSRRYFARMYENFGELYTLILFSIVGMLLIAHTNNLILLFVGIEIMSISFYVLSAIIRTNVYCVEAGMKYFILGSFASAFLLLGISFVYGSTGSMSLTAIPNPEIFHNTYFIVGLTLLFIGLLFKAAVIPFHQWAPDVYTGAPTPITAFMTTAGKAGAVAGLVVMVSFIMRFVAIEGIIVEHIVTIQTVIAVLAAITMIVGNMMALVQKNAKRMLAYSSIAHAGYILMGIASMNKAGIDASIFYSAVYLFMQFGAFIVLMALENKDKQIVEVTDFAGLRHTQPFLAMMMAVFMFALAGIPPFGGFTGKLLLFKAAIDAGMVWLTITAVIGTVVSVYFYINIIIQMYFKPQAHDALTVENKGMNLPLILCAVAVLLLGILPSILM